MTHIIILFHFVCITVGVVMLTNLIQKVDYKADEKFLILAQSCFCIFFILDTLKIYTRHLWEAMQFSTGIQVITYGASGIAVVMLGVYIVKDRKTGREISKQTKQSVLGMAGCIVMMFIGNWVKVLHEIPWICFFYLLSALAVSCYLKGTVEKQTEQTAEVNEIFTKREAEIIRYICEGKSNKEIAEILVISPNTVRNHIYNIYKKAEVKNKIELMNKIKPQS